MIETKDTVSMLCEEVREAAGSLHRYLRHGHLKEVYENGLAHRLRERGLSVQQHCPLNVVDEDQTILGEYFADLLINNQLIVELKACGDLTDAHVAQLLGYLRCSRIKHGLLLNFGTPTLGIKKYVLSNPV